MLNKCVMSLTIILVPLFILGAGCTAYRQQPPAVNPQPSAGSNTGPSATGNQTPPAAITQPSATAQTPPVNKQPAEITVNISNYSFVPQEITVTPGTVVVWKNSDSVPHHLLSREILKVRIYSKAMNTNSLSPQPAHTAISVKSIHPCREQ